jgi:hypothetical protein
MKAYWGVDVEIHIFLTSALVGVEWSASRLGRFIPGKRDPGIHWVGGWVDPRASLDDAEKRKFLILPGLELRSRSATVNFKISELSSMLTVYSEEEFE